MDYAGGGRSDTADEAQAKIGVERRAEREQRGDRPGDIVKADLQQ